MQFHFLPRILAFAAILFAISCSEDTPNEPTPNPVAPALTLEVLSSAPELGQPVEFKATATGMTLTAPEYKWDFGDGESNTTRTGTAQHTYIATGWYTVAVRLVDTVANFDVSDSAIISVISNTPVWVEWNTAKVTLYGTQHGVGGLNDTASVRENYTLTFSVGPITNPQWRGGHLTYDSATFQGVSQIRCLHAFLSPSGNTLDSLYIDDEIHYQGNNSMKRVQMARLSALQLLGSATTDSAVYRVDGPDAIHNLVAFRDESYEAMDYTGENTWTFDSLSVTPDMCVEVRFYNK